MNKDNKKPDNFYPCLSSLSLLIFFMFEILNLLHQRTS